MRPRDVGIDLDKIEGMSGKGSWEGVAGLVDTKETTSRGSRGLNSFLPTVCEFLAQFPGIILMTNQIPTCLEEIAH
jgi:hypothetical protein